MKEDRDTNAYLVLLIQQLQKQVDQCASKDSVLDLAKRLEEMNTTLLKRIDDLGNVKIAALADEQKKLMAQHDVDLQASMRRVIAVQTTILLSALTAIIGLVLNFIFKFIK